MIRLQNGLLARMLHAPLYGRMLSFCNKHSPEMPADTAVSNWLNRMYNDDPNIHILINMDEEYNITEHAVIDVQYVNNVAMVVCHQCQHDKPNSATYQEGIEYIDKLREATNASCSVFFINKGAKALEKKHGYKISRTVMVKFNEDHTEEDQEA